MNIHCLIIDRNPIFRDKLGELIKTFGDDFQVKAVGNVNEAVDILVSTEISLVLCESALVDPKTRLVSCIKDKEPAVPLIITGLDDSPHLTELNTLGIVKGFIPRPVVRPADLAGKVVPALGSLFYKGDLRGINCISLIQILDQECSDCIVRVIKAEEEVEGLLFLKDGVLLDAICGTTEAMEAVNRIFSWKIADVELYSICPLCEPRIDENIASIVLQCSEKQRPGEISPSAAGMKKPPKRKSANKSEGGLAGLFLKKAVTNQQKSKKK